MSKQHTISFILRWILVGLAFAFGVLALNWFFQQSTSGSREIALLDGNSGANDTGSALFMQQPISFNRAVKVAAPAVVNIVSTREQDQNQHPLFSDPTFREFFNNSTIMPESKPDNNLGSGVILDSAGYVLTNAHVITNASRVLITLQDGRQTLAKIIGMDNDTDLAVLKIDLDELPVIPIGDSSRLEVGDIVLAIGNPYNFGQTVTQGIVSATGRKSLGITTFEDFIQTDASINPGNSGGALIDAYGRLMGINTAIISSTGGSQGIGLATPINQALEVMWQIIAYGKVVRGWLGIEAQRLSVQAMSQLKLQRGGVLVAGVLSNGPAQLAGIMPGDVITEINGQSVSNPQQAIGQIAQIRPGKEVIVRILRAWDYVDVLAVVAQRPQFQSP